MPSSVPLSSGYSSSGSATSASAGAAAAAAGPKFATSSISNTIVAFGGMIDLPWSPKPRLEGIVRIALPPGRTSCAPRVKARKGSRRRCVGEERTCNLRVMDRRICGVRRLSNLQPICKTLGWCGCHRELNWCATLVGGINLSAIGEPRHKIEAHDVGGRWARPGAFYNGLDDEARFRLHGAWLGRSSSKSLRSRSCGALSLSGSPRLQEFRRLRHVCVEVNLRLRAREHVPNTDQQRVNLTRWEAGKVAYLLADRAAHGVERLGLFALERLRPAAESQAEQRAADCGWQQRGAEEDAEPRHVSPHKDDAPRSRSRLGHVLYRFY